MSSCAKCATCNLGARFVVPTVAAAVDLVVQLSLDPAGVRRVEEIVAVPGRIEGDVIETETVFVRRDGHLVRAGGRPPHAERFARIGVDVAAVLAGDPADVSAGPLGDDRAATVG